MVFELNNSPPTDTYDEDISKIFYQECFPVSNRLGTSFTSTVQYSFSNVGNTFWIPNQSYCEMRLKLCLRTQSGTNLPLNPGSGIYPAYNLPAMPWSSFQHQMANTTIDATYQYAQTDTVNKRKYYTKSVKESWGTVLFLDSDPVTRLYNSSYSSSGLNAGYLSTTVLFRPSAGLFATDAYVPGSASHQLFLQVDPNWKTKVIESVNRSCTPGTDYDVEVEDLRFLAAMCNVDDQPVNNGSHYISFSASETSLVNCNNTTNNIYFNIKPSTNKISVFLQNANSGVDTQFSCANFNPSGIANMLSFVPRSQLAGNIQPITDIQLYSNSGVMFYQYQRAYLDYVQSCNYTVSDVGNETFDAWMYKQGPIFCYRFPKGNSLGGAAQLVETINFISTFKPDNINAWVFSEYNRVLKLDYVNGELNSVVVEDL